MSNIVAVLRQEISRLLRKEGKLQINPARKVISQHRKQIAALRRQVAAITREVGAKGCGNKRALSGCCPHLAPAAIGPED